MHTPSSFGNTVDIGGVVVGDNIANNYHVYSMNWSPNQISFLVDGVEYWTYNPAVKNANTWPFDKEQYFLLNIAMGGVAGPIDSSFSQTAMDIDYIRVYQNTTPDTQAPTNFTATVGTISGSSVELLLNATDDSGNVTYNVTYGTNGTASTFSPSGVQKSFVISGLSPNTDYSFSVSASDASGNTFINNPIVLNAKTTVILDCGGTDTQAQQGSFSLGYKYNFETIGTDVKITFELLDTNRVGVEAILWKQSPFGETVVTRVNGNIFTKTISGQTLGSTINYACKFAYAGGLSVTKYISYVVGSSCSLEVSNQFNLDQLSFQNPVGDYLDIKCNNVVDTVEIFNMLGKLVLKTTNNVSRIDMKNLSKGMYLFIAYSNNNKIIKKIILK